MQQRDHYINIQKSNTIVIQCLKKGMMMTKMRATVQEMKGNIRTKNPNDSRFPKPILHNIIPFNQLIKLNRLWHPLILHYLFYKQSSISSLLLQSKKIYIKINFYQGQSYQQCIQFFPFLPCFHHFKAIKAKISMKKYANKYEFQQISIKAMMSFRCKEDISMQEIKNQVSFFKDNKKKKYWQLEKKFKKKNKNREVWNPVIYLNRQIFIFCEQQIQIIVNPVFGMNQEFFTRCLDQIFSCSAQKTEKSTPLTYYRNVLILFVKSIFSTFNNSKTTSQSLYSYLKENFYYSDEKPEQNPTHPFLQQLLKEEEHIIAFTQITLRLIMLGILCKLGAEENSKQWKKNLVKICSKTQIGLSFNQKQSLAQLLVEVLQNLSEIFQQIGFYEKFLDFCEKNDLSFVETWINNHLKELKEKWKKEKKQKTKAQTQFRRTKRSSSKPLVDKQTKKIKTNPKNNIKENGNEDNSARQRIKNYYTSNKKRPSIVPPVSRTLHQRRLSLAKNTDQQEPQIVYYDPKEAKLEELIKSSGEKLRSNSKKQKKLSDENALVRETP